MAKDTRKEEVAKSPPEPPAGGTEGNPGHVPIDPETLLSEQEKIAADAPDDDKDKIPSDPKKPYPSGNPPTAEQERRRAMGLPREPTEDEKRAEAQAKGKRPER